MSESKSAVGDGSWGYKICCIGAGYVGGPTMAVMAKNLVGYKDENGKPQSVKITVVDLSTERIAYVINP